MHAPLDLLSAPAREALRLNTADAYSKLTVSGSMNPEARNLLSPLTPQTVLSRPPRDAVAAAGILAGLWLWHDDLDRSHVLAQGISTPSGAMWHAIIHRREGDFWNSKYWYARCENHPILPSLAVNAGNAINPYPADSALLKLTHNGWNADAFVDLVESVQHDPQNPLFKLCVALQQLEWRMLFDHDMRAAAGE